jgi:pyruvate dehydrogenase E1 component alpha subunit
VVGLTCDGNHVLDVHSVTSEAAAICRRGEGPVLLTAKTFRMGGHATHDESEARLLFPPDVFSHWGARDPIGMYETWLTDSHGVSRSTLEAIENRATEEMEAGAEAALARRQESKSVKLTEHDLVEGIYGDNGATSETVVARSGDRT